MNKILKTKKGITLVALVITIIILLILAGITISQLSGSGLFENAKLAEQKSKNAQEKEGGILADYENKIGEYVDGTRNDETVTRAEFEALKTAVSVLQSNSNIHLIKRDFVSASSALTNTGWNTLETVSLAGYGTGKAIISFSASSETYATNHLIMGLGQGDSKINLGQDRIVDYSSASGKTYMTVSTSASINYDENTQINFALQSGVANIKPSYTYSILLIPDNN